MTLYPKGYVKISCDECNMEIDFYYEPRAVDGSVPFLCKECYEKEKMRKTE